MLVILAVVIIVIIILMTNNNNSDDHSDITMSLQSLLTNRVYEKYFSCILSFLAHDSSTNR